MHVLRKGFETRQFKGMGNRVVHHLLVRAYLSFMACLLVFARMNFCQDLGCFSMMDFPEEKYKVMK